MDTSHRASLVILCRSGGDLRSTVSECLRAARQDAGMTQQEAADKAGVTRRWVQMVEAGELSGSVGTFLKLLGALNGEIAIRVEDDE